MGSLISTTQLSTALDFKSEVSVKISPMERYPGTACCETCIFFFWDLQFFFFLRPAFFFFFFETCIFASGMCNSWDVPSCRCFSCPEHPDGSTRMLSVSLEGRQMAHRTLPRLLIQPRAIFSSLLKPHTVTGKQNQLCSCTTGIPLLHQKVNQNWYKG